jgi:hypothetical protein
LLARLKSGAAGTELVDPLAMSIEKLRSAQFPADASKSVISLIPHLDLDAIEQRLAELREDPGKATEIAARLHVELGTSLLTYCYAYNGALEADALMFDPNFVRKHQVSWLATEVRQKNELGSYLAGSLSGLGYQLARLETAQVTQTFSGVVETDLTPKLLFGMRAISPRLQTDRAQEFVALAVRLGRELLAAACLNDEIRAWVTTTVAGMASPRRTFELTNTLGGGDATLALPLLSPSELLLVGKSYFNALREGRVRFAREESCPIVEQMNRIVPEPGAPDTEQFREEVDQYGPLLLGRMGLPRASFFSTDSYEQLENGFRQEALYDRICDLKIRVAEVNYGLAFPAIMGALESELAVRTILPNNPYYSTRGTWKLAIEQIQKLTKEDVEGWIEELTKRGILKPSPEQALQR